MEKLIIWMIILLPIAVILFLKSWDERKGFYGSLLKEYRYSGIYPKKGEYRPSPIRCEIEEDGVVYGTYRILRMSYDDEGLIVRRYWPLSIGVPYIKIPWGDIKIVSSQRSGLRISNKVCLSFVKTPLISFKLKKSFLKYVNDNLEKEFSRENT